MAIGPFEALDNRGMVMRHSFLHPGGRFGVLLPRG
jgi:hypothetical protein